MQSSHRQRVEALVAQMTLDEKLAQIGSYWVYELETAGELDLSVIAQKLQHGIGQITRVGGGSIRLPAEVAKACNQIQRFLIEETRLGIPAIFHEESCCGAMVRGGTVFPQMLGLAATFQPELAEAMATAIRRQLMAVGARQALAPVLDVARDPRWGRVEETFGEDPTLISHFGMAYICGLQGMDLRQGVLATGKHFIGHSLSQGGLNCAPVHLGWQEIYEVCLAPFQAAICKAGLGSIMNAYPELDGEVVAASRRIMTDILRKELGFSGLVVSDYEAIPMIHNYHYQAPDLANAAAMALEAGIDVELPSTHCYGEPLRAALEAGLISLETIDLSVSRHLMMKLELGLLDHPYVDEGQAVTVFANPGDRTLAEAIARQSLVLLQNDGCLPIPSSARSLAVIGPNAADGRTLLGDYTYPAQQELLVLQNKLDTSRFEAEPLLAESHVPSILECLQAAVPAGTSVLYAQGCDHLSDDTTGFAAAIQAARQADFVVLVLGDRSGLTPACTMGETRDSHDLLLPGVQEQLAKAILGTGKPLAVVLVSGRPYALSGLADHCPAILQAWLPGEAGGAAIAAALLGSANPGGKLPITFPRSAGQLPIFYSRKPSGGRSNWYVDYVREKTTPLYPFGHGLSYTCFEYSHLCLSPKSATTGDSVHISLQVTNTGERTGDEVVQLYVRDEFASVPRPIKELKGYVRVSLEPGECRTIVFELPVKMLAFYDHSLNLILEPGRIFVMVGSSSDDIRLQAEFKLAGTGPMPVAERVFVCPVRSPKSSSQYPI